MGDPRAFPDPGDSALDSGPGQEREPAPASTSRPSLGGEVTRVLPGDPLSYFTRVERAERDAARRSEAREVSTAEQVAEQVAVMRELYANGETDAALAVAKQISELPPSGEVVVRPYVKAPPLDAWDEGTAPNVVGAYLASLVSKSGVPRVVKEPAEIAQLPIDHRAGFLLSSIDGIHTMEEILDVCAMPESEALALIEMLAAMGVIELG